MRFRNWCVSEAQKFMELPAETREALYAAINKAIGIAARYGSIEAIDEELDRTGPFPGIYVTDIPTPDRKTGAPDSYKFYIGYLGHPPYDTRSGVCVHEDKIVVVNYLYLFSGKTNEIFRTLSHELGHATSFGMSPGGKLRQFQASRASIMDQIDDLEASRTSQNSAEVDAQIAQLRAQLPDESIYTNSPLEAHEGFAVELVQHIRDYYAALDEGQRKEMLDELEYWLRTGARGSYPIYLINHDWLIQNWKKDPAIWKKIRQKFWTLCQELRASQPKQSWYASPDADTDDMAHPMHYMRYLKPLPPRPASAVPDALRKRLAAGRSGNAATT